ncbi:hypothetical protein M0R45_026203 [Rubus argutus]|uniref:Uncharacterized protein n=1 Tax=Rubus argutus TaxID=59490 RepID=A0AAW1WWA9_RUBAR
MGSTREIKDVAKNRSTNWARSNTKEAVMVRLSTEAARMRPRRRLGCGDWCCDGEASERLEHGLNLGRSRLGKDGTAATARQEARWQRNRGCGAGLNLREHDLGRIGEAVSS